MKKAGYPDPLVRGAYLDPFQNVTDQQHWFIMNADKYLD
jgi:hypothetical protein